MDAGCFTWSNERDHPTHTMVDRMFNTIDQETLLYLGDTLPTSTNVFHFQNFWIRMDGFRDTVLEVLTEPSYTSTTSEKCSR